MGNLCKNHENKDLVQQPWHQLIKLMSPMSCNVTLCSIGGSPAHVSKMLHHKGSQKMDGPDHPWKFLIWPANNGGGFFLNGDPMRHNLHRTLNLTNSNLTRNRRISRSWAMRNFWLDLVHRRPIAYDARNISLNVIYLALKRWVQKKVIIIFFVN